MGDRGFEDFYRDFTPTLVGFLVWCGAEVDEARDLAQETMARAYVAWDRVEQPSAWSRTTAFRAWLRHRRDAREVPGPVPDRPAEVTGQERWEQQDPVLRLLRRLPDRQRQVLAWSVDGYRPAEIAAELGISADNVRQNLAKARRSLRLLLVEEGRL